jgi:hypothetical protein
MRRRTQSLNPLQHGLFQRTMGLLETSFQAAAEADEPFVALRDSLQALKGINELPFFEWTPIEIAFESALKKERTIPSAAYRATRQLLGL